MNPASKHLIPTMFQPFAIIVVQSWYLFMISKFSFILVDYVHNYKDHLCY